MDDKVPAAEAWVCTILFSRILLSLANFKTAIDITAAGMDEANVKPTLSPRYTLDAVKMTVINAPRIMPLSVNSL